jgi:plastocyanin
MKSKIFVFLSILMIFAVACSAPEPAPPELSKPAPSAPIQPAATAPQPQSPAPAPATPPAAPAQVSKTISISIKSFKFTPADVTINVGDTIVWTNEDSVPHTVESSDGTLRSDQLDKSDSFSYKFTKSGKYSYICGIHPSMKGSVTVQ